MLEFHHSVLASGCSGVVEFLSCYTLYLLISSPKDKPSLEVKYITRPTNTSTKKCRKRINACHYYFLSHLRVFSVYYFVKLPPFCNSYLGRHMAGTALPSRLSCVPCYARKLPHTVKYVVTRCILRSTLMLFFQALIWIRTNTHVIPSDTILLVYIYMQYIIDIMRQISVTRYPKNILDVDIDISRKCCMIHREF